MKSRLILLMIVLATPILAMAQAKAPEIEQISLTVHPAALPSPAMRYHFMPDLVDQTAGNAALLYLNAAQQVAIVRGADPTSIGEDQKISQWLSTPMDAFPKSQAQGMVNRYAAALKQMRLASLRALERPGRIPSRSARELLVATLRAALDGSDLSMRLVGEEAAGAWGLTELRPDIEKLARTAPTAFERDAAEGAILQLKG